MLLVGLALVVALVVVVLLGGGAAAGSTGDAGRRRGVFAGALPAVALVGVLGVVALTAVAGVVVTGIGGARDPEPAAPPHRATATTATLAPPPTAAGRPGTTAPPAPAPGAGARPGPEVRVSAPGPGAFPPAVPPLDQLSDGTVVRITATGFLPDTTGSVAQCSARPTGVLACTNAFPVRFDGAGTAVFQYLISSRPGPGPLPGGCGPDDGCVIAVGDDGDRTAVVPTVFGARARTPGRVTVTPRRGIDDGEAVTVSVAGFPAGARLEVVQCVPPGLPAEERCGAPGPVVRVVVGPDGRGSTAFAVRAGPVGTGHHPCRRGRPCGIAVSAPGGPTGAAVVGIDFSAGRGPGYDPPRLALGLGTGALLLAMAAWLIRSTDWREPTEAATPAMDAAPWADL